MPYVLTVDQRASRRGPDRVADVLRRLNGSVPTVLPFERTAGDEFQGVLAEPDVVVAVALQLVRLGGWSMGIGAGPVQSPLPQSTRAGTGPAFLSARRAVEAAKQRPVRLAVRGVVPTEGSVPRAVLGGRAVTSSGAVTRRGRRSPTSPRGGPRRRRRRSSASRGRPWGSGWPPPSGTSSASCGPPQRGCSAGRRATGTRPREHGGPRPARLRSGGRGAADRGRGADAARPGGGGGGRAA